jgi:hypothetical protein
MPRGQPLNTMNPFSNKIKEMRQFIKEKNKDFSEVKINVVIVM